MQEHITLYYREGASDKVYQASLQPQNGGFVVHFAYGRRGSALTTGSKTPQPLDYPPAKAIYDQLVRAKTAKGYTPGESGAPHQHSANAGCDSGLRPQLLNAADPRQVPQLIRDPRWAMQEKHDGQRLLLRCTADGSVEGINRQGLQVTVPPALHEAVTRLGSSLVLDGECMGECYHAFDLLETEGTDLRNMPYHARLFHLCLLLREDDSPLQQVITATTTAYKSALFEEFQSGDREGVVFKRLDAPYRPGRPASGGDALKWKFYETASFLVSRINEQRSVSLGVVVNGEVSPAGNVTIPPNHPVPTPGDIVEVRYLYAFPDSGSVYQPVFLGRRSDLTQADCTRDQLKFKPQLAA
jgi:bifunctional non-homologous end joining protein LigD